MPKATRVTKDSGLTCPACSHTRIYLDSVQPGVHQCVACEAIFADMIWLGRSYELVAPRFDPNPNPETERYFDFTCVSSKGIVRRHGWFNPETRLLTQVG